MSNQYKKTLENYFIEIPNFEYKYYYLNEIIENDDDLKGLKVGYIDENKNGKKGTAFFVHGYPTWSYLWRHLIPIALRKDFRVISIDLPGFGKSDKPNKKSFFTFNNYRSILLKLINVLKLEEITLILHEWGGTLGLTLPMDNVKKYKSIICFNTYLGNTITNLNESYENWINSNITNSNLNVRALMARTNRILSLAECNAYEAPFPNQEFKTALKELPAAFPRSNNINGFEICLKAVEWWKENSLNKSLVLGGGKDPLVTLDKLKALSKLITEDGQTHVINPAGHFVPEWGMDFGDELFEHLED